jgi:CHAD domain-containing protein
MNQARDQDVQLAFLRKAATDDPDLDPLVGALHRERLRTQVGVVEALDSPRYARLRVALESNEEVPDAPGLADLAETAVDHARRQVKRSAKKLDEDASGIAFHHLRKRAKRLRYLLEAATPILGDRAREDVKDLKRLQDILGERQDYAASMETIQHLLHLPDLSRETVRAGERQLERLEREERKCRKRV